MLRPSSGEKCGLVLLAWPLAVMFAWGLSLQAAAEPKHSRPDRLHGWVHANDKDGYTFILRVRGSDVRRTVIYDRDTRHTYLGEDSSIEMVREGWRVICLGRFDEPGRLRARQIDVREVR